MTCKARALCRRRISLGGLSVDASTFLTLLKSEKSRNFQELILFQRKTLLLQFFFFIQALQSSFFTYDFKPLTHHFDF